MSEQADQIRSRRQRLALPGGSHDRLVRVLAIALPAGIGAVLAIMLVAPLFPRGEISFLLDRRKVATTTERLRVDQATFRGQDDRGRSFLVTAEHAVQRTSKVPLVEMDELAARMHLADGPADLRAHNGSYDFQNNAIEVNGPVEFRAANGYYLTTENVHVDLKKQQVTASKGVSGEVPSGAFSADRMEADLESRTIKLEGRAKLTMQGGTLGGGDARVHSEPL